MRQIDKSRSYKYTQRTARCRKMRMRSRLPHGVRPKNIYICSLVRRTMHTHDTLYKIEKIKMAESIREISSEMGDNHGNFDLFNNQDVFEGVIFYYRRFDWKILCILNWIRVYAEKLVNAPKSHKNLYATYTTFGHENIFRRHINICQVYVRYILANIYIYISNIYEIYFKYTTFGKNIFHTLSHISYIYTFSMWDCTKKCSKLFTMYMEIE